MRLTYTRTVKERLLTVDVVEVAEGTEHLNEREAILLASFLDVGRAEHHDNRSNLVQQHSAERRACRIRHLRPLRLLLIGDDDLLRSRLNDGPDQLAGVDAARRDLASRSDRIHSTKALRKMHPHKCKARLSLLRADPLGYLDR